VCVYVGVGVGVFDGISRVVMGLNTSFLCLASSSEWSFLSSRAGVYRWMHLKRIQSILLFAAHTYI
jgi:LytS/YehU family sensor histidine kinase